MDKLLAIRTFHRVVETGSFTRAARELQLTQPQVSKTVASLERALGTKLLQRSTRQMALTDDGRLYSERSHALLAEFDDIDELVGQRRVAPAGRLKVGCPVGFGRLHLGHRMLRFLSRFPGIEVELAMADRFVDLIAEGIDVSVRIGEIRDSGLIARRLGSSCRLVVGAPSYFDRFGEPATPADLVNHNCLVYTELSSGNEWVFQQAGMVRKVRVSGNFSANNSEVLREAILAGTGIGVAPNWLFGSEFARGEVRAVLQTCSPPPLPIHVVYPSRRLQSAKVRAFVDFMAEEFECSADLAHLAAPGPDSKRR